jgi:hypothetical protein
MKNIHKIVTFLMLVVSLSANANIITIGSKEQLISKMSNDDNVVKFLVNGIKLAAYSTLVKSSPNSISLEDLAKGEKAMATILGERNMALVKIYSDYPELYNFDLSERKDIFMNVQNTQRTAAKVAIFFTCIGTAILAVPVCLVAGIAVWKKWAYSACFAAAVATQLALQAANPEGLVVAVDSGFEIQLIRLDAEACGEVVQTGATAAEVVSCVGTGMIAIGTCISEFLEYNN